MGAMTYKKSERGNAMDYSSPPVATTTSTKPASNLSLHELIVLGCIPARDELEVEGKYFLQWDPCLFWWKQ